MTIRQFYYDEIKKNEQLQARIKELEAKLEEIISLLQQGIRIPNLLKWNVDHILSQLKPESAESEKCEYASNCDGDCQGCLVTESEQEKLDEAMSPTIQELGEQAESELDRARRER